MSTLDKKRILDDLKDPESRKLIYAEHISTGLPIQIRELRKKRKITQKKLGEATGMDQSTISDLENPNYEYTPQIGTLKRLADAFDVPLIVRFGSWGELFEWGVNLSPEKVAPPTFDEDPIIKDAIMDTAKVDYTFLDRMKSKQGIQVGSLSPTLIGADISIQREEKKKRIWK